MKIYKITETSKNKKKKINTENKPNETVEFNLIKTPIP